MFGRSKKRELKAAETLAAEVRAQREVTQQLVERYEQRDTTVPIFVHGRKIFLTVDCQLLDGPYFL